MSKDSEEGVKGGVSQLVWNPQLFPEYIILSLIPWFSGMQMKWRKVGWEPGNGATTFTYKTIYSSLILVWEWSRLVWVWGPLEEEYRNPSNKMYPAITHIHPIILCGCYVPQGMRSKDLLEEVEGEISSPKRWLLRGSYPWKEPEYYYGRAPSPMCLLLVYWCHLSQSGNNSCFTSTRPWCCEQRTAL